MNIFSGTFSDNASVYSHTFNNNPLDKLMAVIEESKKFYERLLAAEKEKNDLLMRLLKGKK